MRFSPNRSLSLPPPSYAYCDNFVEEDMMYDVFYTSPHPIYPIHPLIAPECCILLVSRFIVCIVGPAEYVWSSQFHLGKLQLAHNNWKVSRSDLFTVTWPHFGRKCIWIFTAFVFWPFPFAEEDNPRPKMQVMLEWRTIHYLPQYLLCRRR